MLDILSITSPIFILIGLGYCAVRAGFFSRADMRVLGTFVINFALPAMLFKALSQRAFSEVMNAGYLLAYAIGSLFAMGVAVLVARKWQQRDYQSSVVVGMGASMSNSAFIGLPVALQVVGPVASIAMALTMLVENLLMLPILFILADRADHKGASLLSMVAGTFARLLKNPMLVAIGIGFGFALFNLKLPSPLFKVVDMLSLASGPLALFVIGGNLAGMGVKGMVADVALINVAKLLVHPAAVFVCVWLIPGIAPDLRAAAVLFACVPMLSIYAIIGQKYGLESMCAAALVVATVMSFFSISALIWILNATGFVNPLY
ncbi:AEC family transporter [Azoarcus sp. L1K30]|uniref:AEC family transporter n=1 Tax=Azoarcus sp. L1K30 TaxID=2820277 RepID=UPI001B82FFD1|nr:AEC family transporter [Azoarcus sp. L1K30]MBR0564708.1 AEC family transporter [Azoarcus sp. L1K30]